MKGKSEFLKSFVRRLYFKVLLAACRQKSVLHPYFTERYYPLVNDGTKGPVEEYGFDYEIYGRDAMKTLKEKGFRLVGTKRAMQYIATHSQAQLDHPIVVLGDPWEERPYEFLVPVFCRFSARKARVLDVCSLDVKFLSCCRFLVSRE